MGSTPFFKHDLTMNREINGLVLATKARGIPLMFWPNPLMKSIRRFLPRRAWNEFGGRQKPLQK